MKKHSKGIRLMPVILSLVLAMTWGLGGCITINPPTASNPPPASEPMPVPTPAPLPALNPPQLISPPNGATDIELTPTLLWEEVSQAGSYELTVSLNYDFSDVVHGVSTRLTGYKITEALKPSTKYYWFACAKLNPADPNTPIACSEVWAFTTTSKPLPAPYPTPTPTPTPVPTPTINRLLKQYITPDDPEVKAAVNDILSGEWRWAYNDFNALREWVFYHVSPKSDPEVHGVPDYWQLPTETLKLHTGDCEDFAILLCTLLRANGVPPDEVYVVVGVSQDKTYHAYLAEKWYKGVWRVIEPQAGEWTGEFIMDWVTSVSFEERYCFNDQDYLEGHPTLPPGVYESWVDYSLWPATRGASVVFERHLNTKQKVTGSVEWLADRTWAKEGYQIAYDWSLYIYAPDGSTAFSWSGTDLEHDFSFTPTASGAYKIEILKRDYRARGVRLTIEPPDWQ